MGICKFVGLVSVCLSITMPSYNPQLHQLGTETAYAVSAEARQYRDQGKRVFPYHIGDLNFPTPSPITEACKRALDEGKTGYVAAAGIPELRQAMAEQFGKERG